MKRLPSNSKVSNKCRIACALMPFLVCLIGANTVDAKVYDATASGKNHEAAVNRAATAALRESLQTMIPMETAKKESVLLVNRVFRPWRDFVCSTEVLTVSERDGLTTVSAKIDINEDALRRVLLSLPTLEGQVKKAPAPSAESPVTSEPTPASDIASLLETGRLNKETLIAALQTGSSPDVEILPDLPLIFLFCQTPEESLPADWLDPLFTAGVNVNCQNARGLTPLYLALANDRIAIAEKLIEQGAHLNSIDRETGLGLLAFAVGEDAQNDDTLRTVLLLEAGADPNRAVGAVPPVFMALAAVDNALLDLLLAKGADPALSLETPEDLKGMTALHLAVEIGNQPAVRRLMEAGAKPDVRAADGRTPFDMTADAEMLAILSDRPATEEKRK